MLAATLIRGYHALLSLIRRSGPAALLRTDEPSKMQAPSRKPRAPADNRARRIHPVRAPRKIRDNQALLPYFAGTVSCRVEHGDAFDLLETLPPASIDLILTSPPYWGLRTYDLGYDSRVLAKWQSEGGTASECPPYAWYRAHGGVLGLEPIPDWFVAHLV